jgi:sulfur-oxidizing protein SoxY
MEEFVPMKKVIAALGFALALAGAVHATDADPLNSSRWPDLQREYLNDASVAFDPRIEVLAPKVAEDSMNVPVTVRLKGLPDVKRVLVIADFNPIVKVLDFQPLLAQPGLPSASSCSRRARSVRWCRPVTATGWPAGSGWMRQAAAVPHRAPVAARRTGRRS